MTMNLFVLLILAAFASEKTENGAAENGPKNGEKIGNNEENPILVKIEEDDYVKVNKKSKYFGVKYHKISLKWQAQRWSKNENKMVYNGYYDDEETAAHASDTLARHLMENGEQKLKLNFPDNNIEVYPEKSSKFIGVTYNKNRSKWTVQRWSKNENRLLTNGYHHNEETAAHASDTLARKLMADEKRDHKLNFPDDHTEVYPEKSFEYIGVTYDKNISKWRVRRWRKDEGKLFSNGYYDDKETAAHASDTLARKLMADGELILKLNFPDDHTEVYSEENQNKKRKRPKDFGSGHHKNN